MRLIYDVIIQSSILKNQKYYVMQPEQQIYTILTDKVQVNDPGQPLEHQKKEDEQPETEIQGQPKTEQKQAPKDAEEQQQPEQPQQQPQPQKNTPTYHYYVIPDGQQDNGYVALTREPHQNFNSWMYPKADLSKVTKIPERRKFHIKQSKPLKNIEFNNVCVVKKKWNEDRQQYNQRLDEETEMLVNQNQRLKNSTIKLLSIVGDKKIYNHNISDGNYNSKLIQQFDLKTYYQHLASEKAKAVQNPNEKIKELQTAKMSAAELISELQNKNQKARILCQQMQEKIHADRDQYVKKYDQGIVHMIFEKRYAQNQIERAFLIKQVNAQWNANDKIQEQNKKFKQFLKDKSKQIERIKEQNNKKMDGLRKYKQLLKRAQIVQIEIKNQEAKIQKLNHKQADNLLKIDEYTKKQMNLATLVCDLKRQMVHWKQQNNTTPIEHQYRYGQNFKNLTKKYIELEQHYSSLKQKNESMENKAREVKDKLEKIREEHRKISQLKQNSKFEKFKKVSQRKINEFIVQNN